MKLRRTYYGCSLHAYVKRMILTYELYVGVSINSAPAPVSAGCMTVYSPSLAVARWKPEDPSLPVVSLMLLIHGWVAMAQSVLRRALCRVDG